MTLAFGAGLHSTAWTAARSGGFVARAALNYLWNQGENGTACPVTMTFAAVQVLRSTRRAGRGLGAEAPRGRLRPAARCRCREKRGARSAWR